MTEAAGLWWSDSDSDNDSLRNITLNNTISNMNELDEFNDSDSNIYSYRNMHSSDYENNVMDLLNLRSNVAIESAIITAARTGVIHPSLMTPREMADHLTQIKLTLPINVNLPMGTNPNEIYELSKITKMAVFYKESQIVFVIKLPLVTELELTLFRILPIPQPVETMINGIKNKNHSIVLKPEFQYVAITKNREQYTTFTETQLLHCTETEIFTICPEFSPVVHSNNKNPCEIALFKNPDVLPETCETGVLVLSKDIFYKLKHANTWIYTTKGETFTIACRENAEPYITKLRKQGLIWLSSKCRAYRNDIILNPTQEIKSKHYVNFIPEVGQGKISFKVSDRIKSMNLPKIMVKQDSHKLEKIHEIAQSLDKVQQQIDNEILTQSGQLEASDTLGREIDKADFSQQKGSGDDLLSAT
ncbi:uncharacterized protein LOC132943565 [Metopolophium dirhodum]|uniref:uncharacterized protein LOC132943565 n=1 Tax=Metopolophium dirhodum TaxID=44670 RepID=UPI00298FBB70|nr:uncharacterized protein LOC132943565 [Metopolophium dirhodum]